MNTNVVNIMAMLGNWVSGIGTTLAVVYAVSVNKSGIKCYLRNSNVLNRNIEIELFNHKQVKAHITGLYIEFLDSNFIVNQQIKNIELQEAFIGECMEPGHRLSCIITFDQLMKMYFENIFYQKVDRNFNIPEIRIVISVLNGKPKTIKLDKSYYAELLEKFMQYKQENILRPNRGKFYMVPPYEAGKTNDQITQMRCKEYKHFKNKFTLLHPPRFKLKNKARLLLAQKVYLQDN